MTKDEWINWRWAVNKYEMGGNSGHVPQTKRERCEGKHGGDWDRWVWRGDSFSEERAFCQDCGKQINGVPSPWREAARDEWMRTPYMLKQEIKWWTQDRAKELTSAAYKARLIGRRNMYGNPFFYPEG